MINRTISTTIWPSIIRADSVGRRHGSLPTTVLTWTITLGAALIGLASVLTPLGLYEEITPGSPQPVEFQYVQDPSPWGRVTMPRPDLRFGRYCEFGQILNCPGQYQGVYMNETAPGVFRSVKTDETSTVNTTIPANFTAMFSSATGNVGNTISGLFDIQYRRWQTEIAGIIDNGQPRISGDYRSVENLIPQDDVLLKEGLIVDMRDNPGIGFRNHTAPSGVALGGTWSEDLTWIEPVTRCADTNLTIELISEDSVEEFGENHTSFLVDRGAFRGLDLGALETPPWSDNQTLDLSARAYKAARMYNVLIAATFNISLPLDPLTEVVPKINLENPALDLDTTLTSYLETDTISISKIKGILFSSNESTSSLPVPDGFVPTYPNGSRRLFASNFTAIRMTTYIPAPKNCWTMLINLR